MQVLNLTPGEKLSLETAMLATLSNLVRQDNHGNPLGKSNTTTVNITTVSVTRAAVTFIYTHDDTNITSPDVWQVPIIRLRMYFGDREMAIFERHGVINN